MVISEITTALEMLAAQPELFTEANFASRAEALDELEFHIIDRLDGLLATQPSAALGRLRQQAVALQSRLETLDTRLFEQLRAAIRAGQYTRASLWALLAACVEPASEGPAPLPATSYDSLDVFTNGLVMAPAPPLEAEAREPEMVYYQKTPARIIVELAAKITAQDVLYDLGSGLGHVPLLVRLLSDATTKGVEIEPTYCQHARACAEALRLTRVHFLAADARTVDYADGTAFFLFTPFTGRILQQVLSQLQQLALRKIFRLFSYGPVTPELAQQPWLLRVNPLASHPYQLAEFRAG